MYHDTIKSLAKSLGRLDAMLEKGVAHAQAKKFDPAVLLGSRLAPDQWPLTRQVQAACDAAKFAAARLSGKEPPKNPDTETTVDELRARIRGTIEYVNSFSESDFANASTRVIPLGFAPGKGLAGHDYLAELAAPNFYFHLATAYAILRHNGVELGKSDYLVPLSLKDV